MVTNAVAGVAAGRSLSYKAGAPAGVIRPRQAASIGKAVPMTRNKRNIDIDTLRQWLDYNSETGDVVWKVRRCGRVRLGYAKRKPDKYGYYNVTLDRLPHRLHNVIWALHYGEWPPITHDVDHINGCRTDNRIENLRLATRSQQAANTKKKAGSKSRYKGVAWEESRQCWRASIVKDGYTHFLGRFHDEEKAHQAYIKAADRLFGEFARYG